jgi:hypothetical protein
MPLCRVTHYQVGTSGAHYLCLAMKAASLIGLTLEPSMSVPERVLPAITEASAIAGFVRAAGSICFPPPSGVDLHEVYVAARQYSVRIFG